jgi:hypothetical protein
MKFKSLLLSSILLLSACSVIDNQSSEQEPENIDEQVETEPEEEEQSEELSFEEKNA